MSMLKKNVLKKDENKIKEIFDPYLAADPQGPKYLKIHLDPFRSI